MNFYEERDVLIGFNIDRLILELPPFCRLFFNGKQLTMSKLSLQKYIYQLKSFLGYISKNYFNKEIKAIELNDLKQISQKEIREYIAFMAQTTSNNYIVQLICALNVFFDFYLKNDYLENNPVKHIEHPKVDRPIITKLTLDESNRLLAAISNETRAKFGLRKVSQRELLRDKTIITLFLSTGIRLSELVGLDYGNINLTDKTILVRRSKNAKREMVYMTDDLVEQMQLYFKCFPQINTDAPLFVTQDGNRVQGQGIGTMVKKYAKFAGIQKKITPHKLRATFGTNIYQKTHDIFLTAKMLGHSTVNTTTKHYVDLDEELKRRALDGFRIA